MARAYTIRNGLVRGISINTKEEQKYGSWALSPLAMFAFLKASPSTAQGVNTDSALHANLHTQRSMRITH